MASQPQTERSLGNCSDISACNVGVLHTDYNATRIGTSWQSETEAWGAVKLAWELTQAPPAGYHPHDITILTFYEAQLQLIESLLRHYKIPEVQTSTMERAQGSKSEVTILSPVCTNTKFTTNKHRMNVATTRARTQLLIITDPYQIEEAASYGELWKAGLLGGRFALP